MGKRLRLAEFEQDKAERQAKPMGIESDKTIERIRLSPKQVELMDLIEASNVSVITGPAGTSKTFIDCYYAVEALRARKFDRVLLTKPIQEAGEKLGFLPGDVEQKIDPHYESYKITLQKMMSRKILEQLVKDKYIDFRPLAYMRGATFDNTLMILDEAQNADVRQLMLFVTRMGNNSKVLISGDVSQYDINRNLVALPFFADMLKGIKGVGLFEFSQEDIVRNKILIEITERYEKLKAEDKLPKVKS